ncbi:hypothetical protein K470DRAFT_214066 [Piedraia hortae CBS 480.64]|uniref:Thioesterase domain-containing protein n=1 Tax=Piedraia hortae CBS 480.64 TaxID=1314780 RepID=A0A6A7C333_9PEZI|nr:hypothetical protein K470DRAFT_214066 [Piedraia hortae CBS 480.64]
MKEPFLATSWTRTLLESQPNITKYFTSASRHPKPTTEDSLYALTLNTPDTLNATISFYTPVSNDELKTDQVSTLFCIGDGLNGHPNILHGGITATLIDEAMGILQAVNEPTGTSAGMTAYLNVKYLAPVTTPGAVLVEAKYTKRSGRRKEWISARVIQNERVCAEGEALFITPKSSL